MIRGTCFRALIRWVGLAAACFFFSSAWLAAQTADQERWLRLDTESFTFFTNGWQDVARSTAYDLEELDSVVSQLWPASKIDSPVPTYLYVFDSEESFRPYRLTPTAGGDGPRLIGTLGLPAGYLVPHEHGSYAALIIDSEERLDRALAALERATELQADFAPSWAELGYACNLQPEASQKAVEVLEKAADLLPARSDVAFNLLLAYARAGDRQGAAGTVDKLRGLGVEEATLGRAAEMLLQMDYREAAQRVRDKKLDDAIAVFARIQAETNDPALRQQVAEQLEKLEPKMQRDRFWELYNETVQLLHADRVEEAVAVVGRLLEVAKPGLQQKEARDLSQAVEFQRQAAAGSRP